VRYPFDIEGYKELRREPCGRPLKGEYLEQRW